MKFIIRTWLSIQGVRMANFKNNYEAGDGDTAHLQLKPEE
jgi:hypothetical protein